MKLERIAVIGAGVMGSGIAQKAAQEGFEVVLIDREQRFCDAGSAKIAAVLAEGVGKKLFTEARAAEIRGRIRTSADLAAAADADLVVEAVFEDLNLKRELFAGLEKVCRPDAVLATNTSSYLVSAIAEATQRPERVLGLHYFFHPAKNRLLEIIPTAKTNSATLDAARLFAKLNGKVEIVCKDSPGFVVNRLFIPWYVEVFRLALEKVADVYTIDQVVKETFRLGMGPFTLIDVTGLGTGHHAAEGLAAKLGPFYGSPANLEEAMKRGEGCAPPKEGVIDEKARPIVRDRVLGAVFFAAGSLIEEGVATVDDVDRGTKVALRWSQGPFEMMNRLGRAETMRLVGDICARHGLKIPGAIENRTEPFTFRLADLTVKGGIAEITINRPEAGNALNPELTDQLEELFNRAENDPEVRAIVIRGAGKTFVAGADIRFFLTHMKAGTLQSIVEFTRKGTGLLRRIETSKKRTVVVLDGQSLGGGSELVMAAQAVVATTKGSMQFPETGIGIYPGLGGTQRLPKLIGREAALHYIFTGSPISAEEALEMGLVSVLANARELEAAVERVALSPDLPDKYRTKPLPAKLEALKSVYTPGNVQAMLDGTFNPAGDENAAKIGKIVSRKAPVALRMTRDLVDASAGLSIDEGLTRELSGLVEIFSTADAFEGLSKAGRGRPEFKGK